MPAAGPGNSPSSGGGAAQPASVAAANSASRRSAGLADDIPRRLGRVLSRGRGGLIRLAGWRVARHSRLRLLTPEPDAAGQALRIRHDRNIRRQSKGDVLGIAAAEIEVIEADDDAQDLDHLGNPLAPVFFALFLAGRIADVFVVGLVAADRVVGEFQMRNDLAVAEDRGTGAGAERQNHLHTAALDRAKALHICIVEHAHRLAPMPGELRLQVETSQYLVAEIRGGQHPPVAHIAWKADRHPLEAAERRDRLVDGADQRLGSDRLGWGRHPLPVADNASVRVEQGGLDPAAADIDRERARLIHVLHSLAEWTIQDNAHTGLLSSPIE